jgi:hypothetical protein
MPPKLKRISSVVLHKDDSSANNEKPTDSRQPQIINSGGPPEQQQQQQIEMYLSTLSDLEQRVCAIAKDHLKTSFDITRSTGFVAWNSKK